MSDTSPQEIRNNFLLLRNNLNKNKYVKCDCSINNLSLEGKYEKKNRVIKIRVSFDDRKKETTISLTGNDWVESTKEYGLNIKKIESEILKLIKEEETYAACEG